MRADLYFFRLGFAGLLSACLLTACGGAGGGDSAPTTTSVATPSGNLLISTAAAPASTACPNGGITITGGADTNSDGLLSPSEVNSTSLVCNTSATPVQLALLSRVGAEPIGLNCGFGGSRIDSGLDVNGNGQLETGEIGSTAYICNANSPKVWSRAQQLEDRAGVTDINPALAFDKRGNALLVWARVSPSAATILFSRYNPTVGWSSPTVVVSYSTNVIGNLNAFQLVIDNDGNATAAWTAGAPALPQLYTSRLAVGSTAWSVPELLSTDLTATPSFAQLAIDPFGNITAVWDAFNGTDTDVLARRYTPTGGWGAAQIILASAVNGGGFLPQAVADSQGNVMAVWNQSPIGNSSGSEVWQRRYNASTGLWDVASSIDPQSLDFSDQIKLGQAADGNVVATWLRDNGTGINELWGNAYQASTGQWGTAKKFASLAAGSVFSHDLAVDTQGNAMAVWQQASTVGNSFANIWSARFSASQGFSTSTLVELNDNGSAVSPRVVVDSVGNITTLWTQATDATGRALDAWSNVYSPATGWSQPSKISSTGQAFGFVPRLAVDPSSGNALGVWLESNLPSSARPDLWAAVLK